MDWQKHTCTAVASVKSMKVWFSGVNSGRPLSDRFSPACTTLIEMDERFLPGAGWFWITAASALLAGDISPDEEDWVWDTTLEVLGWDSDGVMGDPRAIRCVISIPTSSDSTNPELLVLGKNTRLPGGSSRSQTVLGSNLNKRKKRSVIIYSRAQ